MGHARACKERGRSRSDCKECARVCGGNEVEFLRGPAATWLSIGTRSGSRLTWAGIRMRRRHFGPETTKTKVEWRVQGRTGQREKVGEDKNQRKERGV